MGAWCETSTDFDLLVELIAHALADEERAHFGLVTTAPGRQDAKTAIWAFMGGVQSGGNLTRLGPGSATEGSLPVLGSLLIDLGRETMNSP